MIYRCVDQGRPKAESIRARCRVLGVSRSGYYAARWRSQLSAVACATTVSLKAAFEASGQCYGSRRLRAVLHQQGVVVGRYRVRRLMQQHQLRPRWKRKFLHTTDSSHTLLTADNVLNRDFAPTTANRAWVADITYLRTRSGWLYLAAVLDLYSRKVVGWALAPAMPAELVCSALQMALTQRQPAPGLIVHTDRGSQYASAAHRALLVKHGCIASMSRKGNCWDNAVMERFFLNLKMERVWQRDYANHDEAKRDVIDYIVSFYNSTRLHSTLGYLPPNRFEQITAERQPSEWSEIT